AANVDVASVYAVPALIGNRAEAAAGLARVLDVGAEGIRRKLESEKGFVWIDRKVNPSVAERIRGLGIDGVDLLNESQRFYPKRFLLGHLLGFAGLDNRGLEGLELTYDKVLRGEKGWLVLERDALGRAVFPKGQSYFAPSRGKDIILTIDEGIQHIVETELDAVMGRTRAIGASVIVMDPRTGEILALAVRPDFNPNRISGQDPDQWRNRTVTDAYEPGSTIKIVTAAAALNEGVAKTDEVIYCEEGRMKVAGGIVRDHEKEGYLTFPQVIQRSSNIGTIKIAMRVGERSLYQYLRAFGFGEKSGIDIGGESAGTLRDPSGWSRRSLASISIGQEIAATPVQVVTAAAAVANGGWLVRPHLVSEIRNADGSVVKRFMPEVRRQAVSKETARQMMEILEGTVSKGGTGEQAAIAGYRVAGKTGTAQKIDPVTRRYSMQDSVSSFVGIVPADDPRIVVLVVIDQPEGFSWGSMVAAPVFREIAPPILRHLGVAPHTQERILVTLAR
ncbi:MAG TPA: penicillin-binding transpeptidase domain-containing protein, partial [Nitrospiria bacterium]